MQAGEASVEELAYAKKIGLFDEAPLEECWQKTARPPMSTMWMDVDKYRGSTGDPALVRRERLQVAWEGSGDLVRSDAIGVQEVALRGGFCR